MERFLDILLSILALLLLSPLLVLIIIVLKFTGEGEIFFSQERVGVRGEKFKLLKFATMLKNSPNLPGGAITVRNDPRVLPVGRVLRKTKLNELPQLLNVIRGDMSIVGPRPLTENHYEHYPSSLRGVVSSVRPGLSGVGSIIFRDEERLLSFQTDPATYYKIEIAPYKASVEAWFVDNQTIWLYMKCILVTIWVVLNPSSDVAKRTFNGVPLPQGQLKRDLQVFKSTD